MLPPNYYGPPSKAETARFACKSCSVMIQVPANCSSKVVDAQQHCCASGLLNKNGTCCADGSALDGAGWCCPEGKVDACGVCNGNGTTADVQGFCCDDVLDATGACCQVKDALAWKGVVIACFTA